MNKKNLILTISITVIIETLSSCGNKVNTLQSNSILNNISENMIYIEGGTFTMGVEYSHAQGFGSALINDKINFYGIPAHTVSLSPFSISKYEITQKEWTEVMNSNPSQFKGENLPVENVSWNDCHEFILKLNEITGKNYRLPTEAEWEFIAQSGGNNDWDNFCWYNENSRGTTHPIGTKSPNSLGVYDIMGNVSEWCNDWYEKDYYTRSPKSNPTGAVTGNERVYRGLNFDNSISLANTLDVRYHKDPNYKHPTLGFRLALDTDN